MRKKNRENVLYSYYDDINNALDTLFLIIFDNVILGSKTGLTIQKYHKSIIFQCGFNYIPSIYKKVNRYIAQKKYYFRLKKKKQIYNMIHFKFCHELGDIVYNYHKFFKNFKFKSGLHVKHRLDEEKMFTKKFPHL